MSRPPSISLFTQATTATDTRHTKQATRGLLTATKSRAAALVTWLTHCQSHPTHSSVIGNPEPKTILPNLTSQRTTKSFPRSLAVKLIASLVPPLLYVSQYSIVKLHCQCLDQLLTEAPPERKNSTTYKMKHLAAYLLCQIGGNASPAASDIKTVLSSVGIDGDDERITSLLKELHGKDINSVSESWQF